MADSQPLVRSESVPRLDFKPRAALRPNTKVVYATVDGDLETYQNGKRLKWSDRQMPRYRTRYEVDVSDHYRSVELGNTPPPARGGLYKFSVALTVGYRVVYPVQAVASNIGSGLSFVYGYLLARCPQVTVKHAIEDFTAGRRTSTDGSAVGMTSAAALSCSRSSRGWNRTRRPPPTSRPRSRPSETTSSRPRGRGHLRRCQARRRPRAGAEVR